MTINNYLSNFGNVSTLDREELLKEIDRVWDEIGLNNTKRLSEQTDGVSQFYSHNVWILNGLFSEFDSVSRGHRISIADFISKMHAHLVADYGGGSGTLAKLLAQKCTDTKIDIVEPYPSEYFKNKLQDIPNVKFVPDLNLKYDVLIAQDVLEHVDDPVDLALTMIDAVKLNGHVIFANRFYPDIKCHLPRTFYLRHQFKKVIESAGLDYVAAVPGAKHALVFKKVRETSRSNIYNVDKKAKKIGSVLNMFSTPIYYLKKIIKKYVYR